MGGNRRRTRTAQRGAATVLAVLGVLGVLGAAACDDEGATESEVVEPADVITAIVAWQAAEQKPVLDDDGETKLPVIFVVAGDGVTIDVGIQAEVAGAMVDTATVRFADDVTDTFDSDLDGEPVRDDGVMLLVGPMPDADREVTVDLDRYDAIDEWEALQLEITAAAGTSSTSNETTPNASVTSVTRL